MQRIVFSIWDSKADAFRHPFFCDSRGQAIRQFSQLANDPTTEIGKFPEDFSLYEHGSFDDVTGMLIPEKAPFHCGVALNYLNKNKEVHNA